MERPVMNARKGKKRRTKYVAEFNQAKAHLLEAHRILATSVPQVFTSMTRAQLDDFNRCLKHVRNRRKWAYLQEDAVSLRMTMNSNPPPDGSRKDCRFGVEDHIQAYQRIHDRVMREVWKKIERKRELRAIKDADEKANAIANDTVSCAPPDLPNAPVSA